jgi:hypothetical protein
MRKLGKGQSVVFCSSMEVHRKILQCSNRSEGPIEVADVLRWSISGTCANTKKSIPLWATQGARHQNSRAVCSGSPVTKELVECLLEPEAQTLEERYGHKHIRKEDQILQNMTSPALMARKEEMQDIRAKCREFEITSFGTATLQEQQERELSPENEREQQTELPPALSPCCHTIHNDLRRLVIKGVLTRGSAAFRPAFETLRSTSAAHYLESTAWPQNLLVTVDFINTVQASDSQHLDSFLRPVHWILNCKSEDAAALVILSPYEAQELLPAIRRFKRVTLHMYSPRLSISAQTLEDLSLCAIPSTTGPNPNRLVISQLNLFAGQLYIRSYADYMLLCNFLGLCQQLPQDGIKVAIDGFISPASQAMSDSAHACLFTTSPVPFLNTLMNMRRKGQSIAFSHMGRILNGELIALEETFEQRP